MNSEVHHSGDDLINVVTKEMWKVVMVDDENNQLLISNNYKYMVVNIPNLDVDYNIIDKHGN